MICGIITLLTLISLIIFIIFKPTINIKISSKNISIQSFWVISLIGALCLLIFNQISTNGIKTLLDFKSAMNPFKILILFISISLLSIVLESAGFFELCASFVLRKVKKSQMKLFISLFVLVSILTMFTSNDIIILTFTPFICYFTSKKKISPIPYLVAEFVAANTLSLTFIIGNPTNIYLATYYNLSFFEYFKVMVIPTICLSLVGFLMVFLLFKKQLKEPIMNDEIVENEHSTNKFLIITGLVHLILCTIILVISSYIGFEMWYICLAFAVSITIFVLIYDIVKKEKYLLTIYKHAPYSLIPFVISMFLIVVSLKENGVLEVISNILVKATNNNNFVETIIYGFSSFFACSLINNIPMSVAFASILEIGHNSYFALYSVIIGSNIGAILSPMGALAGIMWLGYLKKHNVKYTFSTFIKNGIIISIPVMFMALIVLYVILI